jgi:hypothetical protein
MVVVGKHQAGIHDNDIVFVLKDRHVLAYAVEASERDDAQLLGLPTLAAVLLVMDALGSVSLPFGSVMALLSVCFGVSVVFARFTCFCLLQ